MTDLIESVQKVGHVRQLGDGAYNRFVVYPDNGHHSSPFVLLVEDWIDPWASGFDMHPHRGFETVTLILEGAMRHKDHLNARGVLRAGDVLWTRAGRGIFHAGRPEGDERLHALQLWLNLPAALKSAEPGTLEQHLADTLVVAADGVRVIVHAGTFGGRTQPHLSLWPLTLLEATLEVGGSVTIEPRPEDRGFLYVIDGEAKIGGTRFVKHGDVVWFKSGDSALSNGVRVDALPVTHIAYYAAPPIHEPVAMHGPFVMTTSDEIRQAYADLKNNTFI